MHTIKNNLYLQELTQNLEGFRQFISCWIYTAHDRVVLVDPGPAATVTVVKKALTKMGLERVDYILLTHIHIDHAGGTGLLLDEFPEAQVICHPKGIPHMIEPQKLWEGSLKVLGEVAEAYGPIAAIPEKNISYPDKISDGALNIDIVETPGHASHHLNYLVDGLLFAGEVAGVNAPVDDGYYLRIATPPRFIYEIYRDSLWRAAALNADTICFGHFGARRDVRQVFDRAKAQLELWLETCRRYHEKKPRVVPDEIFTELKQRDPSMATFSDLPKDIQKREEYFSLNSIKGMLGYLADQK